MAISFPSNPTSTSTVVIGTAHYYYSSTATRWELQYNSGLAIATTSGSITPYVIENQVNTATSYFDLPAGTTAQRPGNAQGGWIRFNTDINSVEYYSTVTSWTSLPFRA